MGWTALLDMLSVWDGVVDLVCSVAVDLRFEEAMDLMMIEGLMT
jgi:hypothetical protein